MTPALEVRELAFAYPDGTQALFGVDIAIDRGERVALLGPNGAGKTTLVLHLNAIHAAQHGEVRVGGLPATKDNLREIRRRVGIVFQDPDDQLFMPTVREDVAFGPANLGLVDDELEERVVRSLEAVGMEAFADRPPHHLSFGQRRRVSVATVLAMEPEILVLDEPSSNQQYVVAFVACLAGSTTAGRGQGVFRFHGEHGRDRDPSALPERKVVGRAIREGLHPDRLERTHHPLFELVVRRQLSPGRTPTSSRTVGMKSWSSSWNTMPTRRRSSAGCPSWPAGRPPAPRRAAR